MSAGYEVRVAGVIGPAAREALVDLTIEVTPAAGSRPATTTVYGEMDADGLHDVLDRIRTFGLELLEIRHVGARHHQ